MAHKIPKLRTHIFTTELASRLLKFTDEKRERTPRRFRGQNYWSLRQLSRDINMPIVTLTNYLNRKTPMNLLAMDRIMAGLGISVLDLLHPRELAARYDELAPQSRYETRKIAQVTDSTPNKVLDIAAE